MAHVDAGKTSLTERLLHAAGVIDEVGSVDDGSTQTDTLALERQRGITIKAAVVSFVVEGVTVNLIDTPGHSDFVAEVERVLGVLDGAVLVVSAVEGVQSQTRVLMRALQRLRIPTLVFVNKIDRTGATYDAVLADLATRLTPDVVAMGEVTDLGTREASFHAYDDGDAAFTQRLVDRLTEHDDAFLAACADDPEAVTPARVRRELVEQVRTGRVHPVFFGSAMTGAGVDAVVSGVASCCRRAPATPETRCPQRSSRSSGVQRGSGSRSCGCTRGRCGSATGSGSGTATRPPSPGSGSSTRATPCAARRCPPVASRSCRVSARCGSATCWGSRTSSRPTCTPSHRRPWRPSSTPAGPSSAARCSSRSPSSPSRTR